MATGFVLTANLRMAISASEIANIKRQLESSLGQGIDLKINAVGSTSLKKINQEVATTTRSFTALKKKVQETDDIFEHFGKQAALSLRRYGAFLLATSGFYKLAASLGEAKDQLIDFNKQILKVAQVTSKSYADLSDLQGIITGLSTSLGVSSKTLSEAAVTLSQAGISAEGTAEALKVLAKTQLSATFDNITNSTEGMIAVINQFGYKTGDMQRVFSQLNAVAAKYPVEAADLVTAIRKTGSSAAATGDQLEDLVGVFSAIRGTTRESADSIATGLRTIFARIQRPRTINFLKEFNVELEEAGKHVSSYESLKRIAEVYQKLPEGDVRRALIIEEVGGIRQASRVIPILTKFAEAEKIRQTALRAGTTLDKEVALAQQGLGNRLAQVGEQFLALTRKMSEQTEFKLLVEFLLRGSEAAIKFADALSQIVPIIGILGATKIPGLLGRFAIGAGQSREGFFPTLTSVKKKASGGYISDGPSGVDKVPAMLTKGEFVFNKPSVDRIGAGNLYKMMAGYASGGVVHLAKGSPKPVGTGFVGGVPISTIQSDLESYIAEFGLKFSKVIKKISILTEKEAERLAKKIEAKSPIGGVYNKGDLKLRDPRLAKHEVRHGIFEALGLGSVTSGPLAEKIKQEQETLKAKYGEESKYAKYRLKPTEIFARMKDEEAIEIVKRQEAYSKKPRIPYKNYAATQITSSGPVTKPRVSYVDYMASITTGSQAHPNPLGLGGSGFSYNPRPGFSKSSSRPPNIPYGVSLYGDGSNRPNRQAHAAFGVGPDKEYSNPDIIKMALVSGIVGEFVSSFKSLGEEAQKTIQSISGAALQFGILSSILKTTGQSAKLSTSIELTKAKTVNTLAKYNEFKRNPTGAVRTGGFAQRMTLLEIQKRIDATDIFSGTGAADYNKLASAKTSIQMRQKYYREAVSKNRAKLAKERAALARQNSAINWTTVASAAAFAGGNALSEYGMTAARTSGQGKYRATGGGALGGAAFGASLGVSVGGAPGAVIGGLIGAISGATIAFYEVSKAVKSFEFDENFKRGLAAISNVNAGRAKVGESLADIKTYFKDTLVSRLASVSGEERMSLQGQIDNALPGLEAFLNNLASGSKTFDEFNKQQSGLVGILARFTGQSIPKLEEGFSGLIKKTQEVKKVNEEYTKEQMRSLARVLEIQTIASGLTNVTSALDDFQSQVEMIDTAMSGRVGEFRPKDAGAIFEAAQRGLNPKGLTDIVKGLGLKLGEGGKDFGNEAIQVSEAIAKLPNILHRARLKGQTDDVSISKSIEDDIANMPIFIRTAFKSALDSGIIGKSGEENNLSIALSTTEGFFEVVNKMGKSLEPFLDTLKELGDTTNKHVTFIEGIYAKQRQYEGALTNLRLKVIDRQQSQEDIFAQLDDRAQNIGLLRSFESRRRESFVSGGSRMTPEGIGAEIATRQANIANLDKQIRTDEIAKKRAEEANQIEKLNRLLEYMADSTNAVTIAQKELEPAIARTNTKFDLAKQFTFGDTKSRRDLGRTIYGAQAVAQGASPERLPPTLRAQVLGFLEANKDVAMFKDKEGKAITGNKVLERAVGLERGKGEEETLREKLVKAIEEQTKAIDVQKKQALESINTLDKVIGGQNETFLKELKQIFENVESGRIGAQEAGLVGKQAQLEKQQGAIKALSDIGIAPEMVDRVGKSLESFKTLSGANTRLKSLRGQPDDILEDLLAKAGLTDYGVGEDQTKGVHLLPFSADREKFNKAINDPSSLASKRITQFAGGDEAKAKALVDQLTSQFGNNVDVLTKFIESEKKMIDGITKETSKALGGIDEKTRTAVVSKLPEVTKQYGTLGETTQADLQNKQNEINILRAEVEELKKRFPVKKAMGGAILNGQNGIDRVPAMLTKGEYVVKKSSAQAFGYGNLDKINKYADGGVVGGGTVATIAGNQLLSQSLNVLKQTLTEIKKKQQLPASQLKAINLNEHWRKKSEEVAAAKIGLGQSLQSNAVAVSNKKYSHKKAMEDNAQRVAAEKARLSESLAKNAERVAKKSGKAVSTPIETSEARFARQNREETQSRISKGVEDTQRKIARDAKIASDLELGIAERDYETSQKEQDRRIKLQNTSKEELKSVRTGPVKSPEELKRGRLELEIMQGRRRTEAVSRLERSTAAYEAEQYMPKMPTKFGGVGFGFARGQNELDQLEKQQYDIRKNTKMRIMEQDKATLREIDRNALQNNSPIPSGRFGNAVGTTTEAQSMGGVVKALQDMVQKLVGAPTSGVKDKVADIFNGKDGLINKLSDAIGGIPSEIDGSFTHNVNVTHNGVEVMTKITPMVEEMVKKETVKAITAFLKRNGLQTELVG